MRPTLRTLVRAAHLRRRPSDCFTRLWALHMHLEKGLKADGSCVVTRMHSDVYWRRVKGEQCWQPRTHRDAIRRTVTWTIERGNEIEISISFDGAAYAEIPACLIDSCGHDVKGENVVRWTMEGDMKLMRFTRLSVSAMRCKFSLGVVTKGYRFARQIKQTSECRIP